MLCGREDPFGLLWSTVPAVSPPSLLPTSCLPPGSSRVRKEESLDVVQALLSNSQNPVVLPALVWSQIENTAP